MKSQYYVFLEYLNCQLIVSLINKNIFILQELFLNNNLHLFIVIYIKCIFIRKLFCKQLNAASTSFVICNPIILHTPLMSILCCLPFECVTHVCLQQNAQNIAA